MSVKTTFEQLCAGSTGYSCEESAMARLNKDESFNDLVFKLITKCETSLLFLPSPTCKLTQFTLDVIPDYSTGRANTTAILSSAWKTCEKQGYDGLKVIAGLDTSNVPQNGCMPMYSFSQFVESIIRSMEAYFMFQKHNPSFKLNALELWKSPVESDLQRMSSCAVVLAWKFQRESVIDLLSRSPLSQLNLSGSRSSEVAINNDVRSKTKQEKPLTAAQRRKSLPASEASKPVTPVKRGRRSAAAPPPAESPMGGSTDEEDPDISFRKKPEQIIPKAVYLPNMMTGKKSPARTPEPMEVEPLLPDVDDITLGFEKAPPKKDGRKSNGRKSLMPDWPEDEKDNVLHFFDNLNPSQTEQSCIAITCKFAVMQYGHELPSKLLYQWVQKKGRTVQRTVTNYELPEAEQKESILEFYGRLNPDISETSRIAFTCKFLHMQHGVKLTSKEFYKWLNDKGKKAGKRH